LHLYSPLFKCQKTINHVVSGTCKDNIPILFICFFYSKLIQCKEQNADFVTLQKWSHSVDILFIDYILIPINQNKHWSVVIIPHLESLGQDDKMQTSCILHLDSLEGGHRQVKRHI
jgi:Ulp1 family protease